MVRSADEIIYSLLYSLHLLNYNDIFFSVVFIFYFSIFVWNWIHT